MAIPDFQTIMLPLLRHLEDGREHGNQDTLDSLARHFVLTDDELAQLLLVVELGYLSIELLGRKHISKRVAS